jgi:bleomycin hydrolase
MHTLFEHVLKERFDIYFIANHFQIYRIISICIGTPPETITWEYYDTDRKYNKIGPITPLEFYQQYVKPHYNISDKVCS